MQQHRATGQSGETTSSTARLVIVGVLVIAATGAAIALTISTRGTPPPEPAASQPATEAPTAGGQVPAPPGVTNPAPYQYHAATNRHYDPNHGHWHAGPPPAQGQRGAATGTQVPAPPGITNPTPFQYDAATDRHYDAQHGHWHSGPPPR